MIPKVLISAPTASAKNYCFHTWLDNVMKFTWTNFDVVLFDNTLDDASNAAFLNDRYIQKYGTAGKFFAKQSSVSGIDSVIERMCISHNDCRQFAIDGGYTHWLHLETDVFPERDIIEKLFFHKKQVVGGIYYRDEGQYRRLCIQTHHARAPRNLLARNLEAGEDVFFIDGMIKKVASVGLGCVLIDRAVFTRIRFRFVSGESAHPDSYFSEDCFRSKIDIWADTASICEHQNIAWGIHGVDFN